MLTTVLVANRGEIAARIIRTCAELGIRSVAVFSDADAKSLHVRLADEAVRLPGVTAGETYLDGDRIVAAAVSSGADAVHPGYGFLSENPSFAAAVESAGLTFVGPSAEVIGALGDKVAARALATAAGVPVIPGIDLADDPSGNAAYDPADGALDRLRRFGDDHGWPLLIKPARGGGGVGMRVVASFRDAAAAVESARAQAAAAFGDGAVYAERYLAGPRHIEVQILGDRHGRTVALGDRDCSVQRRHQKLVEESPAPGLDPALREAMADAALRLARRVGYVGAGTVEFLVQDGAFHFLEMNTRIQVEHPVTEAVLGVDLVREQLLIAGGAPLSVGEQGIAPRGHAVECRVNAEDPAREFLPAPGRVDRLEVRWRPGVRLDTGYEAGDEVPAHYDSLLAKLIVWGPTREIALHRLAEVLDGTEIAGIPTTLPALRAITAHPDFVGGGVSTRWFEHVLAPSLRTTLAPSLRTAPRDPGMVAADDPDPGVWIAGRFHRLPATAAADLPGRPRTLVARVTSGRDSGQPTGRVVRAALGGGQEIRSPMRATVTAIAVAEGEMVAAGQLLGVVEAMKMEHPVTSAAAGRVLAVHVTVGQLVSTGEVLLVVGPEGAGRTTEQEGTGDAAP